MKDAGPLTRVRGAAAYLDDDALAALANKGLVRRARKDLETNKPEITGPVEDRLRPAGRRLHRRTRGSNRPVEVHLPATGVCRHILAALIFLKGSARPQTPGPRSPLPTRFWPWMTMSSRNGPGKRCCARRTRRWPSAWPWSLTTTDRSFFASRRGT